MSQKKNNANNQNAKLNNKINDENVKNLKNNSTNSKAIYNVLGITYFIIMIIIITFLFIRGSSAIDSASILFFVGFFVFMFFVGFKLKMSKKDILMKPIKIFVMIVGIAYLFEFTSTGINNFGLINADSFDIYDIKQSHSSILSENNKTIYFKTDSSDLYIIDEDATVNKVAKYSVYGEDQFDKEVLKSTSKFYELEENIKFSYLLGNKTNEIVIQITSGDKRYLSKINATGFVKLLKEKDDFSETIYSTKDISMFVNTELGIIAYFDNNNFSVNEFDKIESIKDVNYLERGFAFLSNHFSTEYIEAENMSIELVAETVVNDDKVDKINLYSVRAQSSSQFYVISDVVEVIFTDESSIIGLLPVNSDLMKEGVQFDK